MWIAVMTLYSLTLTFRFSVKEPRWLPGAKWSNHGNRAWRRIQWEMEVILTIRLSFVTKHHSPLINVSIKISSCLQNIEKILMWYCKILMWCYDFFKKWKMTLECRMRTVSSETMKENEGCILEFLLSTQRPKMNLSAFVRQDNLVALSLYAWPL